MDPRDDRAGGAAALRQVLEHSLTYLEKLDRLPAHAEPLTDDLGERYPLPEHGTGSVASSRALLELCERHAANTAGPRFLDFVIGGVNPAALAAEWVTALYDQNAAGRVTGALATDVEHLVIAWFTELLALPPGYHGVLVPSATYGNFTGLACARQWLGERLGVNVRDAGARCLPEIAVVGSPYVHPSVEKSLQMLGMGRDCLRRIDVSSARDALALLRNELPPDAPVILVASAGEVNGGRFDPIDTMADVAAELGAWLHVDAAFGMFACLAPGLADRLAGIERADSIGGDAHKWLNVPYDSGFALVADRSLMYRTFGMPAAPYLADLAGADAGLASFGPDASRRARAFPVFASMLAYGRDGIGAMMGRQLAAAALLVRAIDAAPDFRMMTESVLPIVCFRAEPESVPEDLRDEFNMTVAGAVNSAGRFAVGTSVVSGKRVLRVALLNWGVTPEIARELFAELAETVTTTAEGMR